MIDEYNSDYNNKTLKEMNENDKKIANFRFCGIDNYIIYYKNKPIYENIEIHSLKEAKYYISKAINEGMSGIENFSVKENKESYLHFVELKNENNENIENFEIKPCITSRFNVKYIKDLYPDHDFEDSYVEITLAKELYSMEEVKDVINKAIKNGITEENIYIDEYKTLGLVKK